MREQHITQELSVELINDSDYRSSATVILAEQTRTGAIDRVLGNFILILCRLRTLRDIPHYADRWATDALFPIVKLIMLANRST